MNRKLLGGALIGLSWALAASCAVDDREVQFVSSLDPSDPGVISGLPACDAGFCVSPDAGADRVRCLGCTVDGECRGARETNPSNPCEICDPERDATGWAPNDGVVCDDGLFCTIEDTCQGGSCAGTARACDDGVDCNGVSTCVEETGACSAAENQCGGAQGLCDVASGQCVSTCDGCVVDGICLAAGAAAAGNPCLICDLTRSATSYSVAEGQPCGADATECSGSDTCSADGSCVASHLEEGTPCGGATTGGECDAADSCDGSGQCVARRAGNGSVCEDGEFCTAGDQCQGGQCSPGGPRSCGANRSCNENSNECSCDGCLINGICVAAGALDPGNACQVCQPSQSLTSYSANFGAACGEAATECSEQDTCNAQGQCASNHSPAGTLCGFVQGAAQCDAADTCNGDGQCVLRVARDGDPCDDGLFCTQGDRCQGGQCLSGGARNCGANQSCNETADQCRCSGCSVAGTCFASGAVNPANPCQICNPSQNASGFVGNVGAACGSGPSACSSQDSCSQQGQCLPNHSAVGTLCGSPAAGACDAADSCDGSGACVARVAAAGSPCEDGQFCTDADRCQSGQCVAGGPRSCGLNRSCSEGTDSCVLNLAGLGEPCSRNADCANGQCTFWFIDSDGDGFGSGTAIGACGTVQPSVRLLPNQTLTLDGGDCCPSDPGSFPGFRPSIVLPAQTQPDACDSFDRDCSDRVENSLQDVLDALGGPISSCTAVPASVCQSLAGASNNFAAWLGTVPPCGQFGTQVACQFSGGCTAVIGGPLDNRCQ